MEVDLRALADGDFLCLHDATLDRETDGAGPVAGAMAATVTRLSMRADDGSVAARRPMLFSELTAMMRAVSARAGALMQLDFKDDVEALSPLHVERFRARLGDCADRFILTGGDAIGLRRLANGLPALKLGYDPCTDETLPALRRSKAFESFAFEAIATAPHAAYVYLEYPIVLAGLEAGVNVVAIFQAAGMKVDAYTLNSDHPEVEDTLLRLAAAGTDQITTDEPEVLEPLISAVIRQTGR
ncbi:glycerophosphodiester phosphodiesterase (plasmid) [Ensifer adhaerens]|uniref:glycerophosphodiester phosphodiesterase n=1 Tax=Ensifer adhaerens TaxID=106592 RepID=UPI0023A94523|nr:glycerophosphodiester phosphodiesterase family protein [Ensifer adhaerens]WDZ80423.1 glycerophosphodiester phosphodiesterase [Ensifer adhaerens]